jgi:hypothetical protein
MPIYFRFESPPLGSLLGVEGPRPGKPPLGCLSLDLLGEALLITFRQRDESLDVGRVWLF